MRVHVDPQYLSCSMDGAFASGEHGPRRTNPEKSSGCKQSATPLETPPRRVGNRIVPKRSRFRSANRIAKMTNLASYFLASNGCEIELDPRHLRPDYRPRVRPLQGVVFNGQRRRAANTIATSDIPSPVPGGDASKNISNGATSTAAHIRTP